MNAQEIHVQLSETRQHLRSELDSLRSQRDTTTRRREAGPGSLIGPSSVPCASAGLDLRGAGLGEPMRAPSARSVRSRGLANRTWASSVCIPEGATDEVPTQGAKPGERGRKAMAGDGRCSSSLSSSCGEDGEDETGAAQRPGNGNQLRRVRASGRMPARSRVTRGTPVATGMQRRSGGVEGSTASARLQLAANNLRGNDRGNDRARSWLAQQRTGDISRNLRAGGGQSVRVAAVRSVGLCALQPRASSGVRGIVSGVLPVNGGSELPSGRFLGGSWRFGCLTNE